MKILLVEDDHFQAEQIRSALEESFSKLSFEKVDSEHEFYSKLGDIERNPPDVIIMDVMLRWTHPSRDMPDPPEEVLAEKHYRAGFRCLKRLAEREATKRIGVILYTVLESGDIDKDLKTLPSNVIYLRKEANYEPFIRGVRRFTSHRH
jgi:CheY-like chemotaxis protein